MPFAKSEIIDFDNWVFGLKYFFDHDPSTVYEITNFWFKKKILPIYFYQFLFLAFHIPWALELLDWGFSPFCRCLIWIFISLFFLDFDFLPFRFIYHGLIMDFFTNIFEHIFSKRGIKIFFIHKANKKYSDDFIITVQGRYISIFFEIF